MTIKKDISGIWIIGDVHGCYQTLLALIEKIKHYSGSENPTICFVGDLIDRGPHSKQIIELVKSNPNYYCVLGNHEDMMIEAMKNPIMLSQDHWYVHNGGKETLDSYNSPGDDELLAEHLSWLTELPIYIKFKNLTIDTDRERHLVVSHSSIAKVWKKRDELSDSAIKEHTVWNRDVAHGTLPSSNKIYNVFGHTVYKKPHVKPFFSIIDTGCVYKKSKYGQLTALSFPSLKTIQQENIEG